VTREGPEGSNPSPGALIEVLAKAIKPMESEQQATSELISEKTSSAIDLRREAATTTTTTVLRPEAVQSSAVISRDPAGA
jgi:hypothetical protein